MSKKSIKLIVFLLIIMCLSTVLVLWWRSQVPVSTTPQGIQTTTETTPALSPQGSPTATPIPGF